MLFRSFLCLSGASEERAEVTRQLHLKRSIGWGVRTRYWNSESCMPKSPYRNGRLRPTCGTTAAFSLMRSASRGSQVKDAVVFILHSSCDLARLLDEDYEPRLREQFAEIADTHVFFYDDNDGYSFSFFANNEPLQRAYDEYFTGSGCAA